MQHQARQHAIEYGVFIRQRSRQPAVEANRYASRSRLFTRPRQHLGITADR